MTKKMTDAEFAAKCDWEGVEYAVTNYGLTADHLAPDSPLRLPMEEIDQVKPDWIDAIRALEDALDRIDR